MALSYRLELELLLILNSLDQVLISHMSIKKIIYCPGRTPKSKLPKPSPWVRPVCFTEPVRGLLSRTAHYNELQNAPNAPKTVRSTPRAWAIAGDAKPEPKSRRADQEHRGKRALRHNGETFAV